MKKYGFGALVVCAALVAACGEHVEGPTGAAGDPDGGDSNGGPLPPLACEDQFVLDGRLQLDPASGTIDSTQLGGDWIAEVDAQAGGRGADPPTSFVYGVFTPAGLIKLALGDEEALQSTDWHIAFRRYIIRINSGNSGHGHVEVAPVVGGDYDTITTVPAGLNFSEDIFYDSSCTLSTDLIGTMEPAIHGHWSYVVCVKMTYQPFILHLPDNSYIKLVVERFYDQASHDLCQADMQPTNSTGGLLRIRWSYL